MTVELECMYCGHKWEQTVYNKQTVENACCPKCKDSNLKIRDASAAKIDTYKGSPPFPPKPEKKEPPDWTFMGADFFNTEFDAIRQKILESIYPMNVEIKVEV